MKIDFVITCVLYQT